jgi:hypothetical protein
LSIFRLVLKIVRELFGKVHEQFVILFPNISDRNTTKMKLKKIILLAIKGTRGLRKAISEDMDVSDVTVCRWIKTNDDNLTKATCLNTIRAGFAKEGLLMVDSEMLEELPVAEVTN